MNYKIDISDIEIQIKLAKKPGNVLAQASVTFLESIEIHGFTISRSQHEHPKFQEKIWIQPPKIRVGIFWKKITWFQEDLWVAIEEKIYDKYHLLRTAYPQNNEEVDIDDLPDDLGKGI